MPLTVPSHQGIVAPAFLVDRGRLDGVALLIGTAAPDLGYIIGWKTWRFDAHQPLPLLWFCVPVSLLLTYVFRRWIAVPLAVHIPDAARLRLKDVAFARRDRYPLAIGAYCALLGALSHVLADAFTHPEPWAVRLTDGRISTRVELPIVGVEPFHDVLRLIATAAGTLLLVVCAYVTGVRRARQGVPRPHLPAPTFESAATLWVSLVVGCGVGMGAMAVAWHPEARATATMWLLVCAAGGLTVGCVAAGRLVRPPVRA